MCSNLQEWHSHLKSIKQFRDEPKSAQVAQISNYVHQLRIELVNEQISSLRQPCFASQLWSSELTDHSFTEGICGGWAQNESCGCSVWASTYTTSYTGRYQAIRVHSSLSYCLFEGSAYSRDLSAAIWYLPKKCKSSKAQRRFNNDCSVQHSCSQVLQSKITHPRRFKGEPVCHSQCQCSFVCCLLLMMINSSLIVHRQSLKSLTQSCSLENRSVQRNKLLQIRRVSDACQPTMQVLLLNHAVHDQYWLCVHRNFHTVQCISDLFGIPSGSRVVDVQQDICCWRHKIW